MSEKDMHVEDAVDSKLAKVVVRVMAVLMPFVFTSVIALVSWQLREIKAEQKAASTKSEETSRAVGAIASDVRDLNTRFDLIAVKQLDALEVRVNRLEQATRTP